MSPRPDDETRSPPDPALVHRARRRAFLGMCTLIGALALLLPVLRQPAPDAALAARAGQPAPHTR